MSATSCRPTLLGGAEMGAAAARGCPRCSTPTPGLRQPPPRPPKDPARTSSHRRGIVAADGGDRDLIFEELGRHSARLNLGGAYKSFVPETPHRFFEQMNFLHRTFQNFGRSNYEKLGPRACRMRLEDYAEYSPMFCISGRGYYEEALRMMKAPGPISATETSCQCAGDESCVFDCPGGGAGGGGRTHTGLAALGILSPARLPVSPLRHVSPSRHSGSPSARNLASHPRSGRHPRGALAPLV